MKNFCLQLKALSLALSLIFGFLIKDSWGNDSSSKPYQTDYKVILAQCTITNGNGYNWPSTTSWIAQQIQIRLWEADQMIEESQGTLSKDDFGFFLGCQYGASSGSGVTLLYMRLLENLALHQELQDSSSSSIVKRMKSRYASGNRIFSYGEAQHISKALFQLALSMDLNGLHHLTTYFRGAYELFSSKWEYSGTIGETLGTLSGPFKAGYKKGLHILWPLRKADARMVAADFGYWIFQAHNMKSSDLLEDIDHIPSYHSIDQIPLKSPNGCTQNWGELLDDSTQSVCTQGDLADLKLLEISKKASGRAREICYKESEHLATLMEYDKRPYSGKEFCASRRIGPDHQAMTPSYHFDISKPSTVLSTGKEIPNLDRHPLRYSMGAAMSEGHCTMTYAAEFENKEQAIKVIQKDNGLDYRHLKILVFCDESTIKKIINNQTYKAHLSKALELKRQEGLSDTFLKEDESLAYLLKIKFASVNQGYSALKLSIREPGLMDVYAKTYREANIQKYFDPTQVKVISNQRLKLEDVRLTGKTNPYFIVAGGFTSHRHMAWPAGYYFLSTIDEIQQQNPVATVVPRFLLIGKSDIRELPTNQNWSSLGFDVRNLSTVFTPIPLETNEDSQEELKSKQLAKSVDSIRDHYAFQNSFCQFMRPELDKLKTRYSQYQFYHTMMNWDYNSTRPAALDQTSRISAMKGANTALWQSLFHMPGLYGRSMFDPLVTSTFKVYKEPQSDNQKDQLYLRHVEAPERPYSCED